MRSVYGKHFIVLGAIFIAIGISMPLIPLSTLALEFTVKDSVTQQPIKGAYLRLICSFQGGGTMPADGYTNDEGVVYINTHGMPIISWHLTASGYYDRSGSGSPPATIFMVPITAPPTNPVEPAEPPVEKEIENVNLKSSLRICFFAIGIALLVIGMKK